MCSAKGIAARIIACCHGWPGEGRFCWDFRSTSGGRRILQKVAYGSGLCSPEEQSTGGSLEEDGAIKTFVLHIDVHTSGKQGIAVLVEAYAVIAIDLTIAIHIFYLQIAGTQDADAADGSAVIDGILIYLSLVIEYAIRLIREEGGSIGAECVAFGKLVWFQAWCFRQFNHFVLGITAIDAYGVFKVFTDFIAVADQEFEILCSLLYRGSAAVISYRRKQVPGASLAIRILLRTL